MNTESGTEVKLLNDKSLQYQMANNNKYARSVVISKELYLGKKAMNCRSNSGLPYRFRRLVDTICTMPSRSLLAKSSEVSEEDSKALAGKFPVNLFPDSCLGMESAARLVND